MRGEYTYDVEMFRSTFESQYTYLNGFMRNVLRFNSNLALYDPRLDRKWTYGELNIEANRLAHALKGEGVGKNDVVMFSLLNSPEFVFCYLAAHKIGAIACPVNYRQSSEELAFMIDDSKPKVFFYDRQYFEQIKEALRLVKHQPDFVVAVDHKGHVDSNLTMGTSYNEFVAGQSEENPAIDFAPHIYDETTRLYTSGTSGRPKGVPLNNINEVLSAHDVIMNFPLRSCDRTMNMTPWFHRGGLYSGGPCPTLYVGGEVVVLRDFVPKYCLEYVEKYQLSFLIGVPAVLALLARAQERKHFDLSSLKGIVTMGAPFDKSECEKYMKMLTPNIFNGYGTTETFWNTLLFPSDLPQIAGSAGRVCIDDDVRIVAIHEDGSHGDPDEVVPHDSKTVGEIIISSPAKSSMCYFNNPEITAQKFYKGYMYTGDVGTWDEKGFVTVKGRKDDMIVSAGENIYPVRIKSVLDEYPKVAESAVIGIPDKLRGEVVAAYIVPLDNSLTVEEITDYCIHNSKLAPYQWPRVYRIVKDLPHTATGKIQSYKLREEARKEFYS